MSRPTTTTTTAATTTSPSERSTCRSWQTSGQQQRPTVEDPFLSSGQTLYVRDGMRFIFGLLREDAAAARAPPPRRPPSNQHAAVLVASPGVWTSVLLFLAALHRATISPVVYYRKTRDEKTASVFVMTPPDGSDRHKMVRVWFTRNLVPTSLAQGLKSIAHDLVRSGVVDRNACYTFIDGPALPTASNSALTHDTIDGNFDYLCTSAGFSGFAQEQTKKRLWVLDGWSEHEAAAALSLHGQSEEQAEQLFALCGGSIRGMILAARSAQSFRRDLDGHIKKMSEEAAPELAVTSMERSDDPESPDRLRTMFEWRETGDEISRKRMMAYQMVDSVLWSKRVVSSARAASPNAASSGKARESSLSTSCISGPRKTRRQATFRRSRRCAGRRGPTNIASRNCRPLTCTGFQAITTSPKSHIDSALSHSVRVSDDDI
jgi:hypothetical protein